MEIRSRWNCAISSPAGSKYSLPFPFERTWIPLRKENMPRFRALIVDDERLSRQRIRRLLAFEPECELIGECVNGAEAVRVLESERPDLVFLDVQMPEMDGFEVVRAIEQTQPLIIFTSA